MNGILVNRSESITEQILCSLIGLVVCMNAQYRGGKGLGALSMVRQSADTKGSWTDGLGLQT
jgi:hypothetical protein